VSPVYVCPFCKSFKRDTLGGYLEDMSFVFMTLDVKCDFFDMKW